jgi:hypothetical protein
MQAAMDGSSSRAGTMALMAAKRTGAELDGSLGMSWSRVGFVSDLQRMG